MRTKSDVPDEGPDPGHDHVVPAAHQKSQGSALCVLREAAHHLRSMGTLQTRQCLYTLLH